MGRLKIKPDPSYVPPCRPGAPCPQHAALAKIRADNIRLGLPHLNDWYDENPVPCGPVKRGYRR